MIEQPASSSRPCGGRQRYPGAIAWFTATSMRNEGSARMAGPFPCGRSVLDQRDGGDTNVRLRGYGLCSSTYPQ